MKEVISHLPMSPRLNPELGYWNIHCQAKIASNLTNRPYVLSTNLLGEKPNKTTDLSSTKSFLDNLGITPELVWRDDTDESLHFVSSIISRGINEGWIRCQEEEIFICQCGKTEFLNREENLARRQARSTYDVDGEAVKCKVCKKRAVLKRRPCLLIRLPESFDFSGIDFYPEYAKKEVEQFVRFFLGKEYLISRSTPRPVLIEVGEKNFWIDVDLCWIPFFGHLQEAHRMKIEILFTGNRTLKQVGLLLLVNELLAARPPSMIISTPYIDIDFGDKPHLKAEELLSSNGRGAIRVFLGQTMGATNKQVSLPSSEIYLIKKALENYQALKQLFSGEGSEEGVDFRIFLNPRNMNIVKGILKKLRSKKRHSLTPYEQDLLRAILR